MFGKINDEGFARISKVAQDSTPKFYGEVEFLKDQNAAIVTLYDRQGEWSGSGRITHKHGDEDSLYEDAYNKASQMAATKGGLLESFKKVDDQRPYKETPNDEEDLSESY